MRVKALATLKPFSKIACASPKIVKSKSKIQQKLKGERKE